MQSIANELVFYVGRSLDLLMLRDVRRVFHIDRGPFATTENYYSAILDATGKEIEILIEKLPVETQHDDSSSLKIDLTSFSLDSTMIKTEEDEISRKSKAMDEENAQWRVFAPKFLDILQNAIILLQSALPQLCERSPESSGPLTTSLSHQDMSLSNIMVNDYGTPVALLD